jgi:hypothetical protein
MTNKAISPLRQRMIEDMTIRKLSPKTQRDYVQRIKNFAAFLGRSPDTASFEDVRRYQLHLAASGVGVPTLNQTVSTLRFFFRVRLRRHDIRYVAARTRQALDEAGPYGISHSHEYNRNAGSCRFQGYGCWWVGGDEHIGAESYQLGGESWQAILGGA